MGAAMPGDASTTAFPQPAQDRAPASSWDPQDWQKLATRPPSLAASGQTQADNRPLGSSYAVFGHRLRAVRP